MTVLVYALAFVLVLLLVYMARYSGRLRVQESRWIAALPETVYAQVADFRQWGKWNPWLVHDPLAGITLTGLSDASGGGYAWESERAGAGEIRHIQLKALTFIRQKIVSSGPFRWHGNLEWRFLPKEGGTELSCRVRGRVGFSLRAFAQTIQGMVALDCRYGLDRLADLLEPAGSLAADKHYRLDYLGVKEVAATDYAYRIYRGSLNGLGKAVSKEMSLLSEALNAAGTKASGFPLVVYTKTNIKLRTTVCYVGLPISAQDAHGVDIRSLPPHQAYVLRLTGSYTALEIAWYQAMQRLRVENIRPNQQIPPFERYLNTPGEAPESALLTDLYIPVMPPAIGAS